MRRLVPIAAAVVASLLSIVAHADTPPSVWERAKDPIVGQNYKLHAAVGHQFLQVELLRDKNRTDLIERFTQDLKTALEAWGAAQSSDPRLRFDLAELLNERGEYASAIAIARGALAMAPDHPAAETGWWTLAMACGHTGDNACEETAYRALLRLRTEDRARITPLLNLAETEMHQGDLKSAIADYQETIRTGARVDASESIALAKWGLAVAYDRSGDRPTAEKEAKEARGIRGLVSSSKAENLFGDTGVFFYPAYEVYWYIALDAVARARASGTAHEAVRHWEEGAQGYRHYVNGAEERARRFKRADRWVDIARARQKACSDMRAEAEKKAAKEPLPETGHELEF